MASLCATGSFGTPMPPPAGSAGWFKAHPKMPRSALLSRSLFSALLVVGVPDIITAQQPAGGFTAEQAQSGRALYDRNCAACHGIDLEGSGDAPPVAGGTFMLKWGPRMSSELFGLILQTMPPANPGSLDEAAALNTAAYILQRN